MSLLLLNTFCDNRYYKKQKQKQKKKKKSLVLQYSPVVEHHIQAHIFLLQLFI